MGQSATLYRVSTESFKVIEESENKDRSNLITHKLRKDYSTFEDSFMAIEYILEKGESPSTKELISQIFIPQNSLGGYDFSGLSEKEILNILMNMKEEDASYSYLNPDTISKLNSFLNHISDAEIQSRYDADELNDNEIYPYEWHNDNSEDLAYNERHILKDVVQLKSIIATAQKENDYIFVFVG
jgi:Domain of unknown function (DUF1877)